MIKKITTAVLLSASLATSSFAFEQQGVKEGNNVIGFDLRYTDTSPDVGGSSTTTTLFGSGSYFYTDNIELGLGLSYNLSESTGSKSETTTLTPFVQYNFVDVSPTMVPYVGGGISLQSTSSTGSSTSSTGFSFEGGLKMFMSEKTSIVPALFFESYDAVTVTGLKVGVQIYF